MTIAAGTRLGPYEVIAPIGAGGMGEVFRARDTRLDRTVAIKVLATHLTAHPELRERFDREARAISALSHPHVCALYDVGHQDGIDYIVMEYLEGESLADRLLKGPLPLDQVLRYGVQIAEALDRAHRNGIVHRDLKPGNVMLTKSGAKLLDFGLAKSTAHPISGAHASISADSPTRAFTEQRPLTQEGMLVGTFQYMAPEQVEGREADARSDIFAFGCVLYEMTTGRRAFDGKSKASVIASILDREPAPISSVQPLTPPALERVIRASLAKDPDERWQSAHDVATELKWIGEGATDVAAKRSAAPRWREALAWSLALLLLGALIAATLWKPTVRETRAVRSELMPPEKSRFNTTGSDSGALSISPDGQWVTFSVTDDGKESLWLRRTSELTARPIPFTEDGIFPFWSPDSRSIAFFAGGKLKRVDISGGPAINICDAGDGRAGSWNRDGVIIFEPDWRQPIHRVAASGGKSVQITKIDTSAQETTHRWATFLPDGKHFIYLAGSHTAEDDSDRNAVYVASLDSGERKLLLHARSNVAYAAGHLLFVRDRFLLAQRFDPDERKLIGDARPVAENVHYEHGYLRASFAVSDDGTLLYQPAQADVVTTLHWVDRVTAKVGEPLGKAGRVRDISISPDGKRVITEEGEPSDLFLHDLERNTRVRITSHRLNEMRPLWSPDGQRIAFSSDRDVDEDVYVMNPAHPNSESVLARIPVWSEYATSWSPDGTFLLVNRRQGVNADASDVYAMAVTGDARPYAVITGKGWDQNGALSPDGKWIAFNSDESGRYEVYLAPFPAGTPKVQVSTNGAPGWPIWISGGRELLFGTGEQLEAVRVETSPKLEVSAPVPINSASKDQPWDSRTTAGAFDPGGKRFMIAMAESEPPIVPIVMVQNWTSTGEK